MLRVVDGWCVFFNQGCVLHKVGAAEGDTYRYKPAACALFPLARNDKDEWYVRQHGYEDEQWDVFCLDPRRQHQTGGGIPAGRSSPGRALHGGAVGGVAA